MATRVSSPLIIGRQAELATVLIGGDAGIGKSRPVAEISARAAGSFLVLEGCCVSLATARPATNEKAARPRED